MFPKQNQVPKKESEECEIEIKKTKSGKRIRFKGKCSKEQISLLSKENHIDLED